MNRKCESVMRLGADFELDGIGREDAAERGFVENAARVVSYPSFFVVMPSVVAPISSSTDWRAKLKQTVPRASDNSAAEDRRVETDAAAREQQGVRANL